MEEAILLITAFIFSIKKSVYLKMPSNPIPTTNEEIKAIFEAFLPLNLSIRSP